jgi:XTP/dITP diphosphohydrolase
VYVNFVIRTIGIDGILELVKNKERNCEFHDVLAYMDDLLKKPLLFETFTRGTLAEGPRGELHEYNWGELHKIFVPEGESKTFAEMTKEEMESWKDTKQDEGYGKQFAQWLSKERRDL